MQKTHIVHLFSQSVKSVGDVSKNGGSQRESRPSGRLLLGPWNHERNPFVASGPRPLSLRLRVCALA